MKIPKPHYNLDLYGGKVSEDIIKELLSYE